MVEAAASAIAVEAYKDGRGIFGYLSKKVGYADDFKANFEKMTEQAKMLYARRDDVEAEINKNKMKRVTKECGAWIYRVKVAEQEVLKLESKYKKEIVHAWRYARLWSRANLSKHMAKKREELRILLEEGKLDNGVVAERSPEHVRVIDTCGIEDKPSLNWAVEEILGNLRERKIKRIGLWGMVGTGKTTVMQNLNNNKEVKKMFDIVVWVSVSKAWSIEKVQDAITQRLKLRLEGGANAVETAQLISNELGGMRYLLLLDEVWDPFDFHEIGIPNNDNGSKVVFASMDEVLEFLKFCYEDLDGEDKKVCFLYGALFPEDRDIFVDYLIECWKAKGFLDSIDEFQDARDRGHNILHDLINVFLLERSAMKTHVRMNKVLRNMALKISLGGLKKPPKEEEWTSASQISLMYNDLCSLLAISNCTNLSTLLLQRNKNLMMIPESFFLSMQRLRVLDLHATAITSLPPSLPCLTHLRALYLNSCKGLIELPSRLEALAHLEVLDIRRNGIISLPIQVGSLMQMRCLRMSLSNFVAGNPMSNVISSISSLEELRIDVMRTITEEVSTLTQLTSLTFSFPKVECLEIFVRSSPLWKDLRFTFQFSVGICNSVKHHILDYFEYRLCKCLKYANDEGTNPVISEVLTETEVFELIDHKNILSLSDFGTENLSRLRACSVEGYKDIIRIIDENVINNAPSLRCIWKGPVPVGSLGQMTSLTLYNCPKLKKIFSNGLIKQLYELKHLSVVECHEIEEIIIEAENPCLDLGTLPSLKKLVVHDLPKLRSIAPNDLLIWPSLESLDIASCPSLLKLPFIGINPINLRSIDADQSWWSTLGWQDEAIEERLRSFCSFT
ncbi:hypothetical protein EUGRSUZ_G00162 [Eucalyptus grandis]|uniref:Uncharacterized protein n=2 Tax=Eucalyptus grandis TaxID=71139 RepID=A0ACC3JZL5_EUCGR|nr:hypothetical protein EUGRSUZ_G00162 [Eucalyptus grandis]